MNLEKLKEAEAYFLELYPQGFEDVGLLPIIKKHNTANVIVLPARFITNDEAVEFIETYLTTEFEGGRHERRIAKIPVKGRE